MDFGPTIATRLIARFLTANPGVTAELGYTNRPQHMIQGGYDAGVIAGEITDENVIARPAGKIVRYLVAAPSVIEKHPTAKEPDNLDAWSWLALAGAQFGGSEVVTLISSKRAQQTLRITPMFVAEGVTSLREAARAGLGVAVLPDWLAREDLVAGRLVRVLRQWNAPEFSVNVIYPGQRKLPVRARAFVDFAVTYMTAEMHANT
jgi:DNA-binding transcriptional LysR family regulator